MRTDLLLEELLQLSGSVALSLHLSPESLSLTTHLHQTELQVRHLLLSLPQPHSPITHAALS
jgi:hypothetical protein